ncbi:mid1-interacting protein 1-B-like [Argiope bruennichi]|uniref:Mid1-interacting protein 1-B like protein n=1 Tax=Argiope bruennichi TaxID=94029 RepID=A0A8T0EUS6_ARGBR|nr:mid1-interacting protein 1-B-like [Argiope bruennichi]KAF8781494.1 Mid1-interacting protein 1-B like protein [Argiope bruennichi]
MERPRRLSYAGLVKPPQQKSRRISDAGQSGIISHPACVIFKSGATSDSETVPAMMHDSRYEMNNLNRPTRRTSRPSRDDSFTCSQQSVLSAMDRFVKAVNNMDSTVLVPSRLQDMDVSNGNSKFSKCLPAGLNNVDVYRFYNMLKDVKNELLWGPTSTVESNPVLPSSGRSSPSSTRVMKHIRQPSDDSLGSTGFPSDQETDSDIESVVTDRDSMDEHSTTMPSDNHLANAFRHHLLGLHTILHELADSADYLSSRYQEEIETLSS